MLWGEIVLHSFLLQNSMTLCRYNILFFHLPVVGYFDYFHSLVGMKNAPLFYYFKDLFSSERACARI